MRASPRKTKGLGWEARLAENSDNKLRVATVKAAWPGFEEVSFQNLEARIDGAKAARTKGLAASIASLTLGLTVLASTSEVGPEILHKPRDIFMVHAVGESVAHRAASQIQDFLPEQAPKTDYTLIIRRDDIRQDVSDKVSQWDAGARIGGGALLALAAGAFSLATRRQRELSEMENELYQASSRFRTDEGFFWPRVTEKWFPN